MVVKNENLIGDMNICFHVSVFPNSSGEISSPAVRVNWFTELPYHKHHTKASLSIPTEELGQDWQEFIKFEIVLNSYRKSSQIWNLCSANKYPLKFLLVVHIVYSLTRRSNSEGKNRPVKNTDRKTLPGPVWQNFFIYNRSYLAIAFVHPLKLKPKKGRKIV